MNLSRPALHLACLCILLPALLLIRESHSRERPPPAESVFETTRYRGFNQSDIDGFIRQMVERHGFNQARLEAVFEQVRYSQQAMRLIRPAPPGKPKNWAAYRERFVEPRRIEAGVAFWNNFEEDLARAEKDYGVPAEIIVGILGVESIYGRQVGSFRVLDVLTTLAFDYPDLPRREARMAYFRSELEHALLFARDNGIRDPLSLRGSYAGAIGWAQFMPGSIRQFGIDYDGDGKIDLRQSPQDAIGSVAHYLVRHGWRRGDPVAFPVGVERVEKERLDDLLNQGLAAKFGPADLLRAGVKPQTALPASLNYGLIDLQNGAEAAEYYASTENFFAITKYNRSYYYAMSVIELGKAVRVARNPDAR